jgi:hypothetical protein
MNKKPINRKLAVQTAEVLVKQCDGRVGEIIHALQQAMDGEAFKILVRDFRLLPI